MTAPESVTLPRLLVLSDLHLEFEGFQPLAADFFDIAVLAGDIAVGVKSVRWAQRDDTLGGKPVVLVPGNHEFYGSERNDMLEKLRDAAAGSNVHLLDRSELVLLGVRFLGATLWTDFALDVASGTSIERAMCAATRGLNDFCGSIRERGTDLTGVALTNRFTPNDAAREHARSRAWLLERLQAPLVPGVRATVVVTHHGPSPRGMDLVYQGNALNPCFFSALPDEFFQCADLWVHGHSHSSCDYVLHRTSVVANPRGYVRGGRSENAQFDPARVLTLGTQASRPVA